MRPPATHTLDERLAWCGAVHGGETCIAPRRMGHQRANGYWDASFKSRPTYLHRLILIANLGYDPGNGIQARHRCGAKWCVNRSHIIPGTVRDNMRDQYSLGERVMNERHPNCRLSTADAKTIRDAPSEISTRSLAERFGLSTSYVNQIRAGSRRRFIPQ